MKNIFTLISNPFTSETPMNPLVWVVIGVAAAALIVVILLPILKKKKQNKDKDKDKGSDPRHYKHK